MQQQPVFKSAESFRKLELLFRFCTFLIQFCIHGHKTMAWCPSCRTELPATAVNCESCGYDFPHRPAILAQHWAWSSLADLALVAGQLVGLLGAILRLLSALRSLLDFEFADAGVHVMQVALLLATVVAFARVQQIQK
jgi:hypothetical protein